MLKFFIPVFFIATSGFSQINFDDYFTMKSLRVDFLESGNSTEKNIIFQQARQEPYWAGPKNTIDTFDLGQYQYLAFDSASGKLIFNKGYSTLFHEWSTTPEAKKETKAMYESVILPFPKNTIKFVIQSRNKDMTFETIFTKYINPNERFINKENPERYKWFYVEQNGNYTDKVDVLIIPDGYTESEMKKFKEDAIRFSGYLFNSSPYKENKKKFNVLAIEAISDDSGPDVPGENIWKNTTVSTNFYTFNSDRYLTVSDYKSMRDIAGLVPYDQIIILVNTKTYGGGGIYNFFSVVSNDNIFSEYVNVHEFGHAFAGLADEYYDSEVAVEDFYAFDKEPWEYNITTLVKFDKKWKNLVSKDVPVPTPVIAKYKDVAGVYEGAGYSPKKIYRSAQDCTMKSISVDNFCPACKKTIQMMIDFYAK